MIMGMMPTDDRVNGTNKKVIFSVIFFYYGGHDSIY